MNFALDAWAVLELLEGNEPAASRVSEVLDRQPVMSWVNFGEVFYVVKRDQGEEEALETLRTCDPSWTWICPLRKASSTPLASRLTTRCATRTRSLLRPPRRTGPSS